MRGNSPSFANYIHIFATGNSYIDILLSRTRTSSPATKCGVNYFFGDNRSVGPHSGRRRRMDNSGGEGGGWDIS